MAIINYTIGDTTYTGEPAAVLDYLSGEVEMTVTRVVTVGRAEADELLTALTAADTVTD